jgi:hypothetical protein
MLIKEPKKLFPDATPVGMELLCDHSTKNSLYVLAFDHVKTQFPSATHFHFCANDDAENICGSLSHLPLPDNFSHEIFLVKNAHLGYSRTSIIPVPPNLLGTIESPLTIPLDDFFEAQIRRVISDNIPLSPTGKVEIENLKDLVRYLKKNHLVLPDYIIHMASEVYWWESTHKDSKVINAILVLEDENLKSALKKKTIERLTPPKTKEQLAAEREAWVQEALSCG